MGWRPSPANASAFVQGVTDRHSASQFVSHAVLFATQPFHIHDKRFKVRPRFVVGDE
jgi:hypothetical protein